MVVSFDGHLPIIVGVWQRWIIVLGLLVFAAGCVAPRSPRIVSDPDPSVKIPAIKKAAESGDAKTLPQLVKDLENDDPAVRLYSIEALHRLTGQNFGYIFYQSDEQRRPATIKWQDWLRERQPGIKPSGSEPPATNPGEN